MKQTIIQFSKYTILVALGALTVWPLLYVFLGSLKSNQELISGGNLLPHAWSWDNYVQVWKELDFSRYFFNSLVFAGLSAGCNALMGSLAGYVFATSNFAGKRLIYGLVLSVMFISLGPMTLYPKFQVAVDWGLTSSIFTIPIAALYGLGASLFLFEGYVRSIGTVLNEAAKVDGAGMFKRYARIFFPLMMPLVSTMFLLDFIGEWNNYIFPLVMSIGHPEVKTLTVGVVELRNMGDGAAAWNLMMAGSSISIIPMIVVFAAMNRQIVDGLTRGAMKG